MHGFSDVALELAEYEIERQRRRAGTRGHGAGRAEPAPDERDGRVQPEQDDAAAPVGPADRIDAVLFLASDEAAYITGHTLPVTGGRMRSGACVEEVVDGGDGLCQALLDHAADLDERRPLAVSSCRKRSWNQARCSGRRRVPSSSQGMSVPARMWRSCWWRSATSFTAAASATRVTSVPSTMCQSQVVKASVSQKDAVGVDEPAYLPSAAGSRRCGRSRQWCRRRWRTVAVPPSTVDRTPGTQAVW